VRQILPKHAAKAGLKGTWHGRQAGFVTTAYRDGVPDEEIMGDARPVDRAQSGRSGRQVGTSENVPPCDGVPSLERDDSDRRPGPQADSSVWLTSGLWPESETAQPRNPCGLFRVY
jgi:hypothetical protein